MTRSHINRRTFLSATAGALATPMLSSPALAALSSWKSRHGFTLQLWNLQYVESLHGIVSRVGDDQEGALDELYRTVKGKLSIDGGSYPMEEGRVVTRIWAWNLNEVERTVLGYDQTRRSGEPSERKVPTIFNTRAAGAPPLEIKGRGNGLYLPQAGWEVTTRGPKALASLVFDKRQFNVGDDYTEDTYFLICREAGEHTVAPSRDSVGVHVLPKNIKAWVNKPKHSDRKWKVPRVFS